jgi:DNA-binding XRE family transcriptional regulator
MNSWRRVIVSIMPLDLSCFVSWRLVERKCLGLLENQSQIQMISLSQQLKSWRSRYCLSKHEAAEALGVTSGTIEAIERGTEALRGRERQALLDKLSRSPHPDIKGPSPDAGYRPGKC